MSSPEIHAGDVGVVLRFRVVDQDGTVLDISTATTKNVLLKPPAAATKTFAGAFTSDGTDGLLEYTTTNGEDLDEAGTWQRQVHIVLPGVGEYRSSVIKLTVAPNL